MSQGRSRHVTRIVLLALVMGVLSTRAAAEPLKITMTLADPQQTRIDFPLVGAERHWGVYVKRKGVVAEGSTWAGAVVQEVGLHDIYPGDRVWGFGYITFTLPGGDRVSMKHEFAASFLPTPDGKMVPVDHGVWTVIGGTGSLSGIRGVGRFQFKPAPSDLNARVWDLAGDIAVVQK